MLAVTSASATTATAPRTPLSCSCNRLATAAASPSNFSSSEDLIDSPKCSLRRASAKLFAVTRPPDRSAKMARCCGYRGTNKPFRHRATVRSVTVFPVLRIFLDGRSRSLAVSSAAKLESDLPVSIIQTCKSVTIRGRAMASSATLVIPNDTYVALEPIFRQCPNSREYNGARCPELVGETASRWRGTAGTFGCPRWGTCG